MIRCDFEKNEEIFTDGWKGLDFAKSIQNKVNNFKTNFHVYWRVPGEFGRKQQAVIKSIINTQNLNTSNIIVWSNVDITKNEWFHTIRNYVDFRIYDVMKESKNTPLENFPLIKYDDEKNWPGGDLFRILALYKYSGVYSDFDVIYLRDFSPLLEQEFMYQWGTEKTEINGAVMHLFKESKLGFELLNTLPTMRLGATAWSRDLYMEVRKKNKNWTVFPCAFFNTEWQLHINMGESAHPFKCGTDSDKMFPGAFAWHWHNKWDCKIEEGSKFQRLEQNINEEFGRKYNYERDKNNPHLGGNISGGDDATFLPELFEWLLKKYNPTSMLDVGCGEGHAVAWFQLHGVESVGIDGLISNRRLLPNMIETWDLTERPFLEIHPDLILCMEVVEHIEERYVQNIIDTFKTGKIIVMTHALPGQSGYHHVNCQYTHYWVRKMAENGFEPLSDTWEARSIINKENNVFVLSGLIFRNKNT